MTVDQLVAATGLERASVTSMITTLDRRGLIHKARAGCYRRTPAGEATLTAARLKIGPKSANGVDTLNDRLWKALRMMRRGTAPELLEIAHGDGLSQAVNTTQRYLRRLAEAGVTAKAKRKLAGFTVHVLIHDLGPQAPVWERQQGRLFDRNSDQPVADVIGVSE